MSVKRLSGRARIYLAAGVAGLTWLLAATPASAFRPLAVDDADPAGFQEVQVKPGFESVKEDGEREAGAGLELSYGLMPSLELSVGSAVVDHDGDSADGVGDTAVSAKWQFFQDEGWAPALAFAPSVKLPTADPDKGLGTGSTDVGIRGIVSKDLDFVSVHANLGYTFVGRDSFQGEELRDPYFYGGALQVPVVTWLELVGDVFVEQAEVKGEHNTAAFTAGFLFAASKALTIDLGVRRRLRSDVGPDFVLMSGLTYSW